MQAAYACDLGFGGFTDALRTLALSFINPNVNYFQVVTIGQ